MRHLGLGLVWALVCTAGSAYAQDASDANPLGDDNLNLAGGHSVIERKGIALGDSLKLHPKAGIEAGYTTNLFRLEGSPLGAGIARAVVAADLATPDQTGDAENGPQSYSLQAGALLTWDQYISDNQFARDQSTLNADLRAGLILFPKGDFSLKLDEHFARVVNPTNFVSDTALARIQNSFGALARYQPQDGTLSFGLGYRLLIDDFENATSDFASRIQHSIRARAEWEFFPFSTFSIEASYGFYGALSNSSFKQTSNPLRITGELITPITESFQIAGHVGYGQASYSDGEGFQNILGGAQIRYVYSLTGNFSLGYNYGFSDSLNSNYFRDHLIVAAWKQQIDRVLLDASANLILRGYRGIPASIGAPSRDDFIIAGKAQAHYIIRDWVAVSLRADVASIQTNYVGPLGDDPSFSRFDVIAGVAFSY